MPQPKSAKSASSAVKPAASPGRTAARKPAAKKAGAAAGKPVGAGKSSTSAAAQAARDEALRANLAQLRELLAGGVMLTAQRVQEAMDDAVRRGKMTRRDAEELARGLVDSGRRQSFDLLAELEQLLERSRSDLGNASTLVREGTDRVLREVERVRRTAGVGPSLPIMGYDELTAAQVIGRLDGLSASDLRKLREHERANGNRKSVLAKLDKALG